MPDSYVAWNGEKYPWPPPEGWEIRSDGRYWPLSAPAPGAATGPAVTPMAGVPYVAPPKKEGMSGGMKALLIVLAGVVFLFGGCIAAVAIGGAVFSDKIGTVVDEFVESQEEAARQTSIVEGTCRITDGFPTVEIEVNNTSSGRSDYFITVEFSDNTDEVSGVPLELRSVGAGETKSNSVTGPTQLSSDGLMCQVTEVLRLASR